MKRAHADLATKYFMDDSVEIQFWNELSNSWEPCLTTPNFCAESRYREKPKEITIWYRNYLVHSESSVRCASIDVMISRVEPNEATYVGIHWLGEWEKHEIDLEPLSGTTSLDSQIQEMHNMYGLPINSVPTVGSAATLQDRFRNFHTILSAEIEEIRAIHLDAPALYILVDVADLLGDIIIYCRSEALKYGIPIDDVLHIIMKSNLSKLGEDGKPIKDERGKVLKGPNFSPPEPAIRRLFKRMIGEEHNNE